MEEPKPKGRDSKGRFLKGPAKDRRPSPKRKPGEIPIPHKTIAYMDHLGRFMPGNAVYDSRYEQLTALRKAIMAACPEDDIKAIMTELHAICMDRSSRVHQLQAMQIYLDRIMGKPTQELHMEKQTISTKVNVDFTQLSDNELNQMEAILSKTQPPEVKVLGVKNN